MKNIMFLLFIGVTFLGCKKDNSATPMSAKEEYNSLTPAFNIGTTSTQFLNYFRRNDSLFFQETKNLPAIYLDLLAGPSVRIPWAKGSGNAFVMGGYGGSVLSGGNFLTIYFRDHAQNLFSPAKDSLNFSDVKIEDKDVFVEMFSIPSFIENTDNLSHLIHPEKVRKYYGRYNVISQKLVMDK